MARRAGKWPHEVLALPAGDFAVSLALTMKARNDWLMHVDRQSPKGPDKSFGVGHVISLLARLAEEA